jgi:hypothetical protein
MAMQKSAWYVSDAEVTACCVRTTFIQHVVDTFTADMTLVDQHILVHYLDV